MQGCIHEGLGWGQHPGAREVTSKCITHVGCFWHPQPTTTPTGGSLKKLILRFSAYQRASEVMLERKPCKSTWSWVETRTRNKRVVFSDVFVYQISTYVLSTLSKTSQNASETKIWLWQNEELVSQSPFFGVGQVMLVSGRVIQGFDPPRTDPTWSTVMDWFSGNQLNSKNYIQILECYWTTSISWKVRPGFCGSYVVYLRSRLSYLSCFKGHFSFWEVWGIQFNPWAHRVGSHDLFRIFVKGSPHYTFPYLWTSVNLPYTNDARMNLVTDGKDSLYVVFYLGTPGIISSWWFQMVYFFTPKFWANDPIWRAYFSIGLVQRPTSYYR